MDASDTFQEDEDPKVLLAWLRREVPRYIEALARVNEWLKKGTKRQNGDSLRVVNQLRRNIVELFKLLPEKDTQKLREEFDQQDQDYESIKAEVHALKTKTPGVG